MTALDSGHPRPQLQRAWTCLDGTWLFAVDDADSGVAERWYEASGAPRFDREITVPFAPESAASGIGDTGFHPTVWYRRTIRARRTGGIRQLLQFGAVDHDARVWVDGRFVGAHSGGQTAFTLDITDALDDGDEHLVVVRAHDDPEDAEQPRGKQDWQLEPHVIWYHRTTGIWRTVWLEEVPRQHVRDLTWSCDIAAARATLGVRLAQPAAPGTTVELVLDLGSDSVTVKTTASQRTAELVAELPVLRNAQARERWLWSPENPVLVEAIVTLTAPGEVVDRVISYLGIREVAADERGFVLNGRPCFVRAVLEQGYWEQSHFTAPDLDALRQEVELIRELGFNAVRIHQKVEDPRMLYWADRLGLLVWAEIGGAYRYTPEAASMLLQEWTEAVRQQRNHPCVVTWVPINESWGVQDLDRVPAQRSLVRAVAEYTRALDPSRPVISNDGWEHVDSDILTIHDYEGDPTAFAGGYATAEAFARRLVSGPGGRRLVVDPALRDRVAAGEIPVMVTEFGGVSFGSGADDAWGYSDAGTVDALQNRLRGLFDALRSSPLVSGFCYTQLTDTRQETNGLVFADRRPKLPGATIRSIVVGERAAAASGQ